MASIGSAFLGDFQRRRLLSSGSPPPSSPPSSPPPSIITTAFQMPTLDLTPVMRPTDHPPPLAPVSIDPTLALDLRLRWLEALLLGVRQDHTTDGKRKEKEREKDKMHELSHGETLYRMAENIQRKLDAVIEGNEGLKKFMSQYDQHAHLLSPAFALSGAPPEPLSYNSIRPEQLDALLTEMEPDIRAADRDIREIELMEQKGVTGAGKLAEFENLQPRVDTLLEAHRRDIELAASLEKRMASLIERHATHTDALSELFVAWDDTLSGAEGEINKLERERLERRRLGFEAEGP